METSDIVSGGKTKEIINKYDFRMKKKYGQNFLTDGNIVRKIVSISDVNKNDLVLEIGPGIGSMTQVLAEKAGKVIVVEIDGDLIPILKETMKDYNNVEIIHSDILKIDVNELINSTLNNNEDLTTVKCVANLPYYITTPILMNLLELKTKLSLITVMVQKELGQRLSAKPSTKEYGSLTLAAAYYAKSEMVMTVPASVFKPKPNVDSAVVQFSLYDKPIIETKDTEFMFELIRIAFSQRRKTLTNTICNSSKLDITKEEVNNSLVECGFKETVRGEALSLEDYARLSDYLLKYKKQNS